MEHTAHFVVGKKKRFTNSQRRRANSQNEPCGRGSDQWDMFLDIKYTMYLLSAVIGDRKAPYNTTKGRIGLVVWIINMFINFGTDFYEATVVFHISWASAIGAFCLCFVVCTVFMIRHSVKWCVRVVRILSKESIYYETLKKLRMAFKVLPLATVACAVLGAVAQYGCYAFDDALRITFPQDVTFNNTTIVVEQLPKWAETTWNVLRFTSLSHVYFMMFLILFVHSLIFYALVDSQNKFNEHMYMELKSHPPRMEFQTAVNRFASRTKLLYGVSEHTSVVLAAIILTTSVSFVVNAYNFLFIAHYAIYLWFAIIPLIWNVFPLIGGALVTSSYQSLKFIVIQSWVEIPEKYDETWKKLSGGSASDGTSRKKSPVPAKRNGNIHVNGSAAGRWGGVDKSPVSKLKRGEVERGREDNSRQLNKDLGTQQPNDRDREGGKHVKIVIGNDDSKVNWLKIFTKKLREHDDKSTRGDKINDEMENVPINVEMENLKNVSSNIEGEEMKNIASNIQSVTNRNITQPTIHISNGEIRSIRSGGEGDGVQGEPNDDELITTNTNPANIDQIDIGFINEKQICETKYDEPAKKLNSITKGWSAIARQRHTTINDDGERQRNDEQPKPEYLEVKSTEKNASSDGEEGLSPRTKSKFPRRKFNYEKYIKFLELTLETVGYSLARVTLTWDRVSFFLALLATLVGVFGQSAVLRFKQVNTVSVKH